jgi:hypothetical protein
MVVTRAKQQSTTLFGRFSWPLLAPILAQSCAMVLSSARFFASANSPWSFAIEAALAGHGGA